MGVKSKLSLMELLLILPCLLAGPNLVHGQCCPIKVVSGMDSLDDTYTLAADRDEKPEDVCVDACVYTRSNPDSPSEEYCFKAAQTDGFVKCQDVGTVGTTPISLEDLLKQKSALEDEVADLEIQVQTLSANEKEANTLNTELDKVDAKIKELTTEVTTPTGRERRQEPTTCNAIADIIEQIAIQGKTIAERLTLVQQILSTRITKCQSITKLSKSKVKIKDIQTETTEHIESIREKIKKAIEVIKEKKKKKK